MLSISAVFANKGEREWEGRQTDNSARIGYKGGGGGGGGYLV
jgi:hypothetical protein